MAAASSVSPPASSRASPTDPATSAITCVGLVDDWLYYKAGAYLEALAAEREDFTFELRALVEPEWEEYLPRAYSSLGGSAYSHVGSPFICLNGDYLGGYDALVTYLKREFPDFTLPIAADKEYLDLAKRGFLSVLQSSGNSFTYMDIRIGEEKGKRVFFELYQSVCPKTCENFMGLCAGTSKLKYKGSVIHRVVPGGWVQGGDIVSGKGDGGKSIFGDTFEDESFAVKFDGPGVLAMSSRGPHTNGSQFFVTTAALPWLNTKAVAFGRVIRGMASFNKIETLPCINERPEEPVKVDKCGVVDLASTFDLKF